MSDGERGVGLALLGLSLPLPPATAAAKPKAAAADPPKVLVVTSTQDALTTAGLAAINAAARGRRVHGHGTRAGGGRRRVHAGEPRDLPRGGVPEHRAWRAR